MIVFSRRVYASQKSSRWGGFDPKSVFLFLHYMTYTVCQCADKLNKQNQSVIIIHMNTHVHLCSQESYMPSNNHVRLVRLFLKHIHYFVNTAEPEPVNSPYQTAESSPLDEFKRFVLIKVSDTLFLSFWRLKNSKIILIVLQISICIDQFFKTINFVVLR
jgi:hypothetical protein